MPMPTCVLGAGASKGNGTHGGCCVVQIRDAEGLKQGGEGATSRKNVPGEAGLIGPVPQKSCLTLPWSFSQAPLFLGPQQRRSSGGFASFLVTVGCVGS